MTSCKVIPPLADGADLKVKSNDLSAMQMCARASPARHKGEERGH